MRFLFASTVTASLLVTIPVLAETARFYDLEGFGNFLDGNPESTAVGEDGSITLPLSSNEWHEDPTATYSAATSYGDDVVVARADDGRIVSIDSKGETADIAKFEDRMVTAMLSRGRDLYVATGPNAIIHRVRPGREPEEIATLEQTFVWSMTLDDRGDLFVTTGNPGTVSKVELSGGKVETLFEPEQEHLRSIFFSKELGLFVGGGERGVLYRAADKKKFRALFDSGHPEITAVIARDRFAYVSGVTGVQALVKAQGAGETKGAEVRSQMVRVGMDGAAETLAGSNDEAIFAMEFDGRGRVLVATGATGREDPRGRIYAIDPTEREISLLYQSPSRRITQLVAMGSDGVAAVAAAGGRLVRMSDRMAKQGEFLTSPFDTGINSKFGAVRAYGSWPESTSVTMAIRSGQTSSPDATWSEWSEEINAPGGQATSIPNGRYLQARLTLNGNGKVAPTVHRIRVAYLRQNLPPFVREVATLEKGVALLSVPRPPQSPTTVNLEAGNAAGGDAEKQKKAPSPRARKVQQRGALTVRWVADDPNGDALEYDLRYRSLGNRDWTELESELEEPFYTLNSAQLPDGHYQFQVRATDAPSNPDGVSMADTRESRAVLIDNTSPKVERAEVRVDGRQATLRVAVADNVGPIMTADYAVDGRDFRPMPPDDGVLDGSGETFTLRLQNVAAGQHSVTVRVRDEANNEGYGQARFEIR